MKRSEPEGHTESRYGKGPALKDYRICPRTTEILAKMGITTFFPIQSETYDLIFDGKDIMGRDITGSGKTLAYILPLIEKYRQAKLFESGRKILEKSPILMVVLPTRELVIQVSGVFEKVRHNDEYQVVSVYGGAPIEPQINMLWKGADILVGTTGRLLDHLKRGTLLIRNLQCVVLDEADRMLDMGFQEDIERIFYHIRNPQVPPPQCLLFSATFPPWVQKVAGKYMKQNFIQVDLVKDLKNKTVSTVRHFAISCPDYNRSSTLADISISSFFDFSSIMLCW